eukprot:758937_1
MWVGRLKVLSTATECTLQFENIEDDKVYLKVLINNDPNKPTTVESCADSSRYFALNICKPGSDQIFELGLGFQNREEAMDFKMATGEFERMKNNLEEAKKLNTKITENFSLKDDEVLVMKPMKKNKKKEEIKDNGNNDGFDGFLPPPSDSKGKKKKSKGKKKKKKVKKTDNDSGLFGDNGADNSGDLFGDFTKGDGGDDASWATFD